MTALREYREAVEQFRIVQRLTPQERKQQEAQSYARLDAAVRALMAEMAVRQNELHGTPSQPENARFLGETLAAELLPETDERTV
jgi:hypothetical protein